MTPRLLKTTVLVPAVLTCLAALVTIGFMAGSDNWSLIRFAASLYVLGMGAYTTWYLYRGGHAGAFLAGAFMLAILGAAGGTYGMLQVDDPEYWAVLLCMLLTAQGGTTINYLWTQNTHG